jgi:ABC-2 type transport system ATP-binding protein
MVITQALTKRFGALTAVDNLDLHVAPGEFFAFLGPNAAGKDDDDQDAHRPAKANQRHGRIDGHDMQREPLKAKAQLAYVPDFPFLYDKLTSLEFMQFVGDIFRLDRKVAAHQTLELFDKFHLNDYSHELTENLSHGTKQRLVIASALLHNPKILVIDDQWSGSIHGTRES